MKISNEQISALQESEVRKKSKVAEEGFASLLSEQLGSETARGTSPAGDAPSVMRQNAVQLFPTEASASVAADAAANSMATRMESLFAGMDDYAAMLGSDDASALRGAYSLLENMTGEIASFRAAYPNMETAQPELASLVNELEVLTVTETFKFNRGDYL